MFTLNKRSIAILKGEEKVFLDINKREDYICTDLELFKRFRILRKDIARKENIKAYIVFTDSMIMDIINKKPKDRKDLKEIKGFGEEKISKYGAFIITLLKDYEKGKKRN